MNTTTAKRFIARNINCCATFQTNGKTADGVLYFNVYVCDVFVGQVLHLGEAKWAAYDTSGKRRASSLGWCKAGSRLASKWIDANHETYFAKAGEFTCLREIEVAA